MDRDNTIARLENIAKHAVHTAGEDTFILSLDDGLAIHEAIEALKAQLSSEGTTSDTISRQAAIDAVDAIGHIATMSDGDKCIRRSAVKYTLSMLPTSQPVATDTNVGDKISKFIDGLEEIFADLRERHVDDSVCGLCEYDGAYMGQSGNWCNECPGFDRDDCFKLSDKTRKEWTEEIIKALPTIQPEPPIIKCKDCKWWRKQKDSAQGRCRLLGIYPTGAWYCANAERRTE